MKHFYQKLFILSALTLFGFLSVSAATVTYNGLNYSTSGNKASVDVYAKNTPYPDLAGVVTIPETFEVDGVTYTVTGIKSKAFKDCTGITELIFPETLESIAANAFEGCTALVKADLPDACTKYGAKAFFGCTSLKTNPIPSTATALANQLFVGCTSLEEAYIPAGVTKITQTIWAGCPLKKVTIEDSETALNITTITFGNGTETLPYCNIEEIYYGRPLELTKPTGYPNLFKGKTSIKKVVIGEKVTTTSAEEFMGCTGLTEVAFAGTDANFKGYGASTFSGCTSLTTLPIPAHITSIPNSLCYNCKSLSNITLNDNITTISDYAFTNAKLTLTTLPAALTSVGTSAFEKAIVTDALTIPNTVKTIKANAFFGCTIKNLTMPNDPTTFGTAALGLATIEKINLENGGGEATLQLVEDKMLTSIDGKTLEYTISNTGALSNATVEVVNDYALGNTAYESIDFPNAKAYNYRAFQGTANLKEFTIKAGVELGTYLFYNSGIQKLTIEEGLKTLPVSTCEGCANLSEISLPESLNVMMNNALAGCTSLKTITLGKYLNYLEGGTIPATIETINCKNFNVPVVNEALFNESQSNVTCNVPSGAVDAYKKATGWKYLNIVGDASITGEAAALGCPSGLYFATKAGELLYLDENGNIADTGVPAGLHAFQLGAAHNRVYVGYAGNKFTYQDAAAQASGGDGETFYINKSGDSFFRVTLVSNIGYKAFEDPFSLSVDANNHQLLVADRNVGVHVIDTERPGLYGSQPFLLQNNWLPWYNAQITYGAIGCGMERDSEGVYWMGKKYNGLGIFRFKEDQIYADGGVGQPIPSPILFENVYISTFTLDEANGYLYVYAYAGHGCKPGLYRFNIADLKACDDLGSMSNSATFATHGTLIDDSPVALEGTAPSEITGITQISSNGTNVYWSYIAPASADSKWIGKDGYVDSSVSAPTAVPEAVTFDPSNPLHKSGIKVIDAKNGDKVTFAVENVEAYGCVAYVYDASYGTGGVESAIADKAAKAVVKGASVEVPEDATVRVVAINGAVVAQQFVAAGSAYELNNLAHGVYLVQVAYVNGAKEVVKVVK